MPIDPTTRCRFRSADHAASRFGLKELGNSSTRITHPTADVREKRIAARQAELRARGEVLRDLAQGVPVEGGRWVLRVGPTAVPRTHPAASLHGPEALVALSTERYPEVPLVIRGPGAGGAVTAAGVLADMLRVARERPGALPELSGRQEARGLGLF